MIMFQFHSEMYTAITFVYIIGATYRLGLWLSHSLWQSTRQSSLSRSTSLSTPECPSEATDVKLSILTIYCAVNVNEVIDLYEYG